MVSFYGDWPDRWNRWFATQTPIALKPFRTNITELELLPIKLHPGVSTGISISRSVWYTIIHGYFNFPENTLLRASQGSPPRSRLSPEPHYVNFLYTHKRLDTNRISNTFPPSFHNIHATFVDLRRQVSRLSYRLIHGENFSSSRQQGEKFPRWTWLAWLAHIWREGRLRNFSESCNGKSRWWVAWCKLKFRLFYSQKIRFWAGGSIAERPIHF